MQNDDAFLVWFWLFLKICKKLLKLRLVFCTFLVFQRTKQLQRESKNESCFLFEVASLFENTQTYTKHKPQIQLFLAYFQNQPETYQECVVVLHILGIVLVYFKTNQKSTNNYADCLVHFGCACTSRTHLGAGGLPMSQVLANFPKRNALLA